MYWYWFTNIAGIGRKKQQVLLEYCDDVEAIWKLDEKALKTINILKEIDVSSILKSRDEKNIHKEFLNLKKWNVEFLSIENRKYPTKLKNIFDYPYGVYYSGNSIDNNALSIAVIGARNCSEYGVEMATYFARELSKAGVQVISGLARGIDTYAHKGALMANGNTIGVLGNGIDICYPNENIKVMDEIIERGGVMSEYNLGVQPKAGFFPMRNRIISALSDGILVIEAKEKSGSLITANIGLEHGKDIFALPGRAFDKLSVGTNCLIQAGAKLTTRIEDILEEYYELNGIKSNELNYAKFDTIIEKKIYELLDLQPQNIDELGEMTNFPMSELLQGLLNLEIQGVVRKVPNGGYIRTI